MHRVNFKQHAKVSCDFCETDKRDRREYIERAIKSGAGNKKERRTEVRRAPRKYPDSPLAILRMSRDNYRKSNCEALDVDIAAGSRREDSSVAHKPFVTAPRLRVLRR